MDQSVKTIKTVFKDYKVETFELAEAIIHNINLYKKTNRLELELICNGYIKISDLINFEKYVKQRFQINLVEIKIQYKFKEENQTVDIDSYVTQQWSDFVIYLSSKYPMCRAMLKGSEIQIDDSKLVIKIKTKCKEILKSKGVVNDFTNMINDLYGKKYQIKIKEDISEDYLKKVEEDNRKREQEILDSIKLETNVECNMNEKQNSPVSNKKQDDSSMPPMPDSYVEDVAEEKITPLIYGRNMNIREDLIKINDIAMDTGRARIDGTIVRFEDPRELKSGKFLISFNVYDGTSTITCKAFLLPDKLEKTMSRLKVAKAVSIGGNAQYDNFAKEITVLCNTIVEAEVTLAKEKRTDNAKEKRVELLMHTQMSQMDGISSAKDIIKRAMSWGMKSIAITDHGVVQSYPEAHKLLGYDNEEFKVLYGVEAYLALDKVDSVSNPKGQPIDDTTYCVFDLETTGFSFRTDKITEVGLIKIKNGEKIGEFACFVNPEKPIPQEVVEVTNITDDMVKDAEKIEQVLPKMLEFIGDSVLVAHNADFDMGFIKYNAKQQGFTVDNTYIDTLRLAKQIFPNYKRYKLGFIAESLGIKVEVAHRALDDVETTVKVFNVMLDMLKDKGANLLDDIDKIEDGNANFSKLPFCNATIFAKNYIGLKNLYRLVSLSHLEYFYRKPRILKSIYEKYSEGLMIGSGDLDGELYKAILNGKEDDELEQIARSYDYLEIQPVANNMQLVRRETVPDAEELRNINKKIVEIGQRTEKLVVADGDVHYLDPQDEIYRRIILAGQLGNQIPERNAEDPLYFRTTDEMLEEFSYLGDEKAYEVVVTNTNKISDMCERISPISSEKCPPEIPGSEEEIRTIAYDKAYELYGEELPELVKDRTEKELDSIIKNGFSVMYIIAQKLVWKSNEDGYIVGSRGSVGSSFVAYLTGITEVNSLPPHYRCPSCKYSDFSDYGQKNGFDLPDKKCPKCGANLDKDGMDIPFETFLGFNGDKEPDIDLNFSGEYQAKAHKYTEVIFGKGTTFKAGTVGTVADKTAFGYVRNYYEENQVPISNAEVLRLAEGCTGIKRTTGQHPGGIIVVPKGREIYEFTPVQHPADDAKSDIITTHFDYHSIDQNLLKLDILGHDDPTVIRMLYDLTGYDPTKIRLDDKETMKIFSSTESLGVRPDQIHSEVGTFGIPEFGTKFVRGMLVDTRPNKFEELLRISGLSHGTDVWLNNAQALIEEGTITLGDAICTRDDIMIYLIKMGLPSQKAFKIMEGVRKGKGLTPDQEELMKEFNVPNWYIDSCKKIKYMFPKAHAAAYVTNAFRIAWFKVHIPIAYYTAYFSIRADDFDYDIMCLGKQKALNKMKEIDLLGNTATKKEKDLYSILEIVVEMYERGIDFLPVDLYKSDSTKFKMEKNGIRPPLNSIPGLGTVAAEGIQEAKLEGKFMSIDDLRLRSKVGKSVIELLTKEGCLKGMSQSNQMSLFA